MKLLSEAFADGQAIPQRHGCDGADLSPPLHWSDAPAATKGFALVCEDPDAPSGTWYHWGAYGLAPSTRSLAEGFSRKARVEFARQVLNDFGKLGYGGPCPPKGHGLHHYLFRLFAVDVASLSLAADARCPDLLAALRPHVLGEARLTGTYRR